jgi:hypothetical protein
MMQPPNFIPDIEKGQVISAEWLNRVKNGAMGYTGGHAIVSPEGTFVSDRQFIPDRIGKTNASHAKGASGTINIYRGRTKGSETFTTGDTMSAYNRFADIGSGKWVLCRFVQGGWEIVAAEC